MLSYTHYTDDLPQNVGGSAKTFFIRIRHKYRNDKGIHAHEETHVAQWWRFVFIGAIAAAALYSQGYVDPAIYAFGAGLVAHMLLYTFIDKYKLWCEVQAYKEQLKHYEDDRTLLFARFIVEHYNLKITINEAKNLLTK